MMPSFHITSIKDARVVEARELTSVAGRARFQKTQLEGEESVQWALEAHLIVEHVFYSANLRPRAFLEMLQAMALLEHKPVALVVGNETEGISDEMLQQANVVVQIPMSGTVESLNVGVATGISLYELKFRMVLTMLTHFIRSNFGREVNITGQMIMQAFDHALRNVTELNALQVVMLMMLAVDRQMSRAQAGRDTATFGTELEALLQPLLDRNYVVPTQSGEQEALQITPEGERAIAQLWGVVEQSENEVLAGFSGLSIS
jgi:RNA methyltransferase, TrmH family